MLLFSFYICLCIHRIQFLFKCYLWLFLVTNVSLKGTKGSKKKEEVYISLKDFCLECLPLHLTENLKYFLVICIILPMLPSVIFHVVLYCSCLTFLLLFFLYINMIYEMLSLFLRLFSPFFFFCLSRKQWNHFNRK